MTESKKVTRRMMVQAILDKNWNLLETEEYQTVAQKYADSMDKNANKPKEKTSARIQNETKMRQVYQAMKNHDGKVTTKWIMEHVNGIMSSQKLVWIMKIGEEWGIVEVVKEKKETFYQLTGKEL